MSAAPSTLALLLPEDPCWPISGANDASPDRIGEELLLAERTVLRLEAEEAHLKKSGAGEGELLSEVRSELQSEYLRVIRLRRESVSSKPEFLSDQHSLETFQDNADFNVDACSPPITARSQLEIETRLESQRRESQAALLASFQPLAAPAARRERGPAVVALRRTPTPRAPSKSPPPERSTEATLTARWNCTPFTALSTPKQSPRAEAHQEPSFGAVPPLPPRQQGPAVATTAVALGLLLRSSTRRATCTLSLGAWKLAVVAGRSERILELELATHWQPRQNFSGGPSANAQGTAARGIVTRLLQRAASSLLCSSLLRWRLAVTELRNDDFDAVVTKLRTSASGRMQAVIMLRERCWRHLVARLALLQWQGLVQRFQARHELHVPIDDQGRAQLCQVFCLWRLVIRWAGAERRVKALRSSLCNSQVQRLEAHMRLRREGCWQLLSHIFSTWARLVLARRVKKSGQAQSDLLAGGVRRVGQNIEMQNLAQCAAFKIWEQYTHHARASSVEAARIDRLHQALGDAEGRHTRFADACGHCCLKAWSSTQVPLAWSIWKSWTRGRRQVQAAAKERQGSAGWQVAGACWAAWRHAASKATLRNGRARCAGRLGSTLDRAAMQGQHANLLLVISAWQRFLQSERQAGVVQVHVKRFHAAYSHRVMRAGLRCAGLQAWSLLAAALQSWRHEVELQRQRLQAQHQFKHGERLQVQFARQALWVSGLLLRQLLRLVLCAWVGAAALCQRGRADVSCTTAIEAQRIGKARLKVWLRQRVARTQFASILDFMRMILANWWQDTKTAKEQHLVGRIHTAKARFSAWIHLQLLYAQSEEEQMLVCKSLLAWQQAASSLRRQSAKAQHARITQHMHRLLRRREDRASHVESLSLLRLTFTSWQWLVAESRTRWLGVCRVAELQTRLGKWLTDHSPIQLEAAAQLAAFLTWAHTVAVMQRQQLTARTAGLVHTAVRTRLGRWQHFQEAREVWSSALQSANIVFLLWLRATRLAREDASSLMREAEAITRRAADAQLTEQRRRASLRAAQWASLGHATSLKALVLAAWVRATAWRRLHLAARQHMEARSEALAWLEEALHRHMCRANARTNEGLQEWMFAVWVRAAVVARRDLLELQRTTDTAVVQVAQGKIATLREQYSHFVLQMEAAAEIALLTKVLLAWLHGTAVKALEHVCTQRLADAARNREAEDRLADLLSQRAVRASRTEAEACLHAVFALWCGLHRALCAQRRSEQGVMQAFTQACLMTEERVSQWSAFHDRRAARSAVTQMLRLTFLVWLHSSMIAKEEATILSREAEVLNRRARDAALRERRLCALAPAAQWLLCCDNLMLMGSVLTAWLRSSAWTKAVRLGETHLLRLEEQQRFQAAHSAHAEALRLAGAALFAWLSAATSALLLRARERQLADARARHIAETRLAACLSQLMLQIGAVQSFDGLRCVFVAWRGHQHAEQSAKSAAEARARRASNQQLKIGLETHAEMAMAQTAAKVLESTFARWSWAVLSACVAKCRAQLGKEVSTRRALQEQLSRRAAFDRAAQMLGVVLTAWFRVATARRQKRLSSQHVALVQAADDARTVAEVQLSKWWHCYAVQAEIYEKVGRSGVAFVAWLRAIALSRKDAVSNHSLNVITWLCNQAVRTQRAECRWIQASVMSAWARAAACAMEDRMYLRSLAEAEQRRAAEARLAEWTHHLAAWANVAETTHHLEAGFAAWSRATLLARDELRQQKCSLQLAAQVNVADTVRARMAAWLLKQALLTGVAGAAELLWSAFTSWRLSAALGKKRDMEYGRMRMRAQQEFHILRAQRAESRCSLHAALATWCCARAVSLEERRQLVCRFAENAVHVKASAFMMWWRCSAAAREGRLHAELGDHHARQQGAALRFLDCLHQQLADAEGVRNVCLLFTAFSAWMRLAASARNARHLSWRVAEREANNASHQWLRSQVCQKALQAHAVEEALLLSTMLSVWWRSIASKRDASRLRKKISTCLQTAATMRSSSSNTVVFFLHSVFVEWARLCVFGAVRPCAGSSFAACRSCGNTGRDFLGQPCSCIYGQRLVSAEHRARLPRGAAILPAMLAAWGRLAAASGRERVEQRSAVEAAATALAWAQAADLEASAEEARRAQARANAQAQSMRHRVEFHRREALAAARTMLCTQVFAGWRTAALTLRLEGELAELELNKVVVNQGSEIAAEHMVDATIAREQALRAESAAQLRFVQVAGAEARLSRARAEATAQVEALRLSFHAQGCALALRRMATAQQRAFLAWGAVLTDRIHQHRLEQYRRQILRGRVFYTWRSMRQVAAVERRHAVMVYISVLEQVRSVLVAAFFAWSLEVSAVRHSRATGKLAEQLAEADRQRVEIEEGNVLVKVRLSRFAALCHQQVEHLVDDCLHSVVKAALVAWQTEARHARMHMCFAEEAAISSSGRAADLAGAIAQIAERCARACWASWGAFALWLASMQHSRTLNQVDAESLQRAQRMTCSVARIERCTLLAGVVHEWCAQVQSARAEHWLQALEAEHQAALEDSNLRNDQQLEAVHTKHQVSWEEAVLQHGQQLEALNAEHSEKLELARTHYDERIEALKVEQQMALQEAAALHGQHLELAEAEQRRSLQALKAEHQCSLQEQSRLTQQLDIQRYALQAAHRQRVEFHAFEALLLNQRRVWALLAVLAAWRGAVLQSRQLVRCTAACIACSARRRLAKSFVLWHSSTQSAQLVKRRTDRLHSEKDRMLLLLTMQKWLLRSKCVRQLRAKDLVIDMTFTSSARCNQLRAIFSAWVAWKCEQACQGQLQARDLAMDMALKSSSRCHRLGVVFSAWVAWKCEQANAEEKDRLVVLRDAQARAAQRHIARFETSEALFSSDVATWTRLAAWVAWRAACVQSSRALACNTKVRNLAGTSVCWRALGEVHAAFCLWCTWVVHQRQLRQRAAAFEVLQTAAVEQQQIAKAFCLWSVSVKSRTSLQRVRARLHVSRERGISVVFVAFRAWSLSASNTLRLHSLNQAMSRRCSRSKATVCVAAAFWRWTANARVQALEAEHQGLLELTEFRQEQRLGALHAEFQAAALQTAARHEHQVGEMRAEQRQALQQRMLQHEQRISSEVKAQAKSLRRTKRQSAQLRVYEEVFSAKLSWWALLAVWVSWRALLENVQASCRAAMHAAAAPMQCRSHMIGFSLVYKQVLVELSAVFNLWNGRAMHGRRLEKRLNAYHLVQHASLMRRNLDLAFQSWHMLTRSSQHLHSRTASFETFWAVHKVYLRLAHVFNAWELLARHVKRLRKGYDACDGVQSAAQIQCRRHQAFQVWCFITRSSRHLHSRTVSLDALWAFSTVRGRLISIFHTWGLLTRDAGRQQQQYYTLGTILDTALLGKYWSAWQFDTVICKSIRGKDKHARELRVRTCNRLHHQVSRIIIEKTVLSKYWSAWKLSAIFCKTIREKDKYAQDLRAVTCESFHLQASRTVLDTTLLSKYWSAWRFVVALRKSISSKNKHSRELRVRTCQRFHRQVLRQEAIEAWCAASFTFFAWGQHVRSVPHQSIPDRHVKQESLSLGCQEAWFEKVLARKLVIAMWMRWHRYHKIEQDRKCSAKVTRLSTQLDHHIARADAAFITSFVQVVCLAWNEICKVKQARKHSSKVRRLTAQLERHIARADDAYVRAGVQAVCTAWQEHCKVERAKKHSTKVNKLSCQLDRHIARANASEAISVVQVACIAWQEYYRTAQEHKRSVRVNKLNAQLDRRLAHTAAAVSVSVVQVVLLAWRRYQEMGRAKTFSARLGRLSAQLDGHIARWDAAHARSVVQAVCTVWHEYCKIQRVQIFSSKLKRLAARLDLSAARSYAAEAMLSASIVFVAWQRHCKIQQEHQPSGRIGRLVAWLDLYIARAHAAESMPILQRVCTAWRKYCEIEQAQKRSAKVSRSSAQLDHQIQRGKAVEAAAILSVAFVAWQRHHGNRQTQRCSARVGKLSAQLDHYVARADVAETTSLARAVYTAWQEYSSSRRMQQHSLSLTRLSAQLDRHVARSSIDDARSLLQVACITWQRYYAREQAQKHLMMVSSLSAQLHRHFVRCGAIASMSLVRIALLMWCQCHEIGQARKHSAREGRLNAQLDCHIARTFVIESMSVVQATCTAWREFCKAERARKHSAGRLHAQLDRHIARANAAEALSTVHAVFTVWASGCSAAQKPQQQYQTRIPPARQEAVKPPAGLPASSEVTYLLQTALAAWVLLTVAQRAASTRAQILSARARWSRWLKWHAARASHRLLPMLLSAWSATSVTAMNRERVFFRQSDLLIRIRLENLLRMVLAAWKHGLAGRRRGSSTAGAVASALSSGRGESSQQPSAALSHEKLLETQQSSRYSGSMTSQRQHGLTEDSRAHITHEFADLSAQQLEELRWVCDEGLELEGSAMLRRRQGVAESSTGHATHELGSLSDQQLADLLWAGEAGLDLEHSRVGAQHWSMTEGEEHGEHDHGCLSHDSHFGLSDQQLRQLSGMEVLYGSPVLEPRDRAADDASVRSLGSQRRVSFFLDDEAEQSEAQLFPRRRSDRRAPEHLPASSTSEQSARGRVEQWRDAPAQSAEPEGHGIGSSSRSGLIQSQLQRFAAHVQSVEAACFLQVLLTVWARFTTITARTRGRRDRVKVLLDGSMRDSVCMRLQLLMVCWRAEAILSCTLRSAGIFRNELGIQVARLTLGVRLAVMFTVWRWLAANAAAPLLHRDRCADHAVMWCAKRVARMEMHQLSTSAFLLWRAASLTAVMAARAARGDAGAVSRGEGPLRREVQDALQMQVRQLEEQHAEALHQVAVLEVRCAQAEQWRDSCAVDDEEALRLARVIDKQLRLAGQEMEMASPAKF